MQAVMLSVVVMFFPLDVVFAFTVVNADQLL